jgi:putative oxidoreductase
MSLSRLVARPLLAAGVVYGAVNALRETDVVARKAQRVTDRVVPAAQRAGIPLPDDPATLVRLNAGVQLLGGLAIATGKAPRLGATAVAASLVPTTVAAYPFWSARTPEQKHSHQTNFFRNLSIIGGAIIAAGDTDGKPGLSWRARRAAKDARREARHLATSAKREARLAKAKVS